MPAERVALEHLRVAGGYEKALQVVGDGNALQEVTRMRSRRLRECVVIGYESLLQLLMAGCQGLVESVSISFQELVTRVRFKSRLFREYPDFVQEFVTRVRGAGEGWASGD